MKNLNLDDDYNSNKVLKSIQVKESFAFPIKLDGHKFNLSAYVVNFNGLTFYAIHNNSGYDFSFRLNFEDKETEEIIGPRGQVDLSHQYALMNDEVDIFLLIKKESFDRVTHSNIH